MTFTNKAYMDKQSELELVSPAEHWNLTFETRKQSDDIPIRSSETPTLSYDRFRAFFTSIRSTRIFPTSPERRLRNPYQSVFPNVKVALPSCFLSASSRSLSFRASYFLSKAPINSWSEPVPSYSNNTTATFSTTPSWRSCSCFCFKAASSSWLYCHKKIIQICKNRRLTSVCVYCHNLIFYLLGEKKFMVEQWNSNITLIQE